MDPAHKIPHRRSQDIPKAVFNPKIRRTSVPLPTWSTPTPENMVSLFTYGGPLSCRHSPYCPLPCTVCPLAHRGYASTRLSCASDTRRFAYLKTKVKACASGSLPADFWLCLIARPKSRVSVSLSLNVCSSASLGNACALTTSVHVRGTHEKLFHVWRLHHREQAPLKSWLSNQA